jgi:hypothetical protein
MKALRDYTLRAIVSLLQALSSPDIRIDIIPPFASTTGLDYQCHIWTYCAHISVASATWTSKMVKWNSKRPFAHQAFIGQELCKPYGYALLAVSAGLLSRVAKKTKTATGTCSSAQYHNIKYLLFKYKICMLSQTCTCAVLTCQDLEALALASP